jgi:hypothetical protein
MTPIQFCIARVLVQLQKKKRHDGLTDQEAEALAFCEERVAEYAIHEPILSIVDPDKERRESKLPAGEMDRRALINWPAEWGKRT